MKRLQLSCCKLTENARICLPVGLLLLCMLASCVTATSVKSTEAATPVPPSAKVPITNEAVEVLTTQAAEIESVKEPLSFPLSEPGPYYVGSRTFTYEDTSRDGREIGVTIYYPALLPEGSSDSKIVAGRNRKPDLSGAPYPLLLTENNSGEELFQTHFASHGFAMAIVRPPQTIFDLGLFENARDFLFVLEQISSNSLDGLEGVIDSEHVGVTGHSWGGAISLGLSGVRIDPEFYLSFCDEQVIAIQAEVPWDKYKEYSCSLAMKWEEFVAYVGPEITTSEDGLWQPLTDQRIRAVLPIAPDGAWLYGEKGLSMADRPILIIAPTDDEYTPYEIETKYIFDHIGSPERFMISFIGRKHMFVLDPEMAKRLHHFATAFFGYYLQGKPEYRDYFSEEFIARYDDFAWGVYQGE